MTLEAFEALPEVERALWQRRHQRGRGKCPTCGGPLENCAHPESVWYPQRRICYADRERAAAERAYERLHKDAPYHDGTYTSWAKEASDSHPYHFNDGVTIGVAPTDMNPDDEFTTKRDAVPFGTIGARLEQT